MFHSFTISRVVTTFSMFPYWFWPRAFQGIIIWDFLIRYSWLDESYSKSNASTNSKWSGIKAEKKDKVWATYFTIVAKKSPRSVYDSPIIIHNTLGRDSSSPRRCNGLVLRSAWLAVGDCVCWTLDKIWRERIRRAFEDFI